MFTGIVGELGTVRSLEGGRLVVEAVATPEDLPLGASVAVNGCCLTAVEVGDGWFAADVVDETLRRTSLGALAAGDPVNLERPLRADGRFDGHIVQGHVDATGTIESHDPLRVAAPPAVLRYVVEKGSVAVDGVSLTVVSVDDTGFTVALIPHTAEVTTLGRKGPGDAVNLEVDVVAKYVERLARGPSGPAERDDARGPSGPTERDDARGPSGPTERENRGD